MPRYEKSDPKKGTLFIDARVSGTRFDYESGPKPKKVTSTKYKTPRQASVRFTQVVKGARTKGYEHASKTAPLVENLELEAAIAERLDDDDAREVYGDWLLEQGDPRGQLIALQRKGKSAVALIADNSSRWFGTLDEILHEKDRRPHLRVTWRLGFFDEIEVRLSEGGMPWFPKLSEATAMLASLQSARFTRRLILGGSAGNIAPALGVVAAAWPKTLRSLCVTGQLWGEYTPEHHKLGPLEPLCNAHPQLEELELYLNIEELGHIALPALRKLALWTNQLGPTQLADIARAAWPKVEDLDLEIGSSHRGLIPDDLARILDAKTFPSLVRLRLGRIPGEMSASLAAILANSTLLDGLRAMTVSTEGAAAFIAAFETAAKKRAIPITTADRET